MPPVKPTTLVTEDTENETQLIPQTTVCADGAEAGNAGKDWSQIFNTGS